MTGPTGAGRARRSIRCSRAASPPEINIVTIEDPIEYQLAGISQVQVNAKAGLTFASCLRAILRQDPDVILVGEIRDLETAEIAFQAALTGHMVSQHAAHKQLPWRPSSGCIDLGVKPLLVTSATNLIMAQRLARRICMKCREPYTLPPMRCASCGIDADGCTFQHGKGCEACGYSGYSGRVGIFEILPLTPELKETVNRERDRAEAEVTDKQRGRQVSSRRRPRQGARGAHDDRGTGPHPPHRA